MNKSILIITYKFPPMSGIGTRRWVKFAKFLGNKGYDIHILKAKYDFVDKMNWEHDVTNNIQVHTFKSKYPQWFLSESTNKITKQIKRYANFILGKSFFDLDIAQYDAKAVLTKAKNIILQNEIRNVIATGHPVSINYIATYLKIDDPKLNLIQDFRDNWNDLNVYQFGNKEGFTFFKQKEKSAYKELFTLTYSDYIVNVSEDLTDQLQMKHKNLDKLLTITNGFDKDDFNVNKNDNTQFNMIYTGSLFNNRIEAIELLLDAMIALDDTFINENFTLVIFSNYDIRKLKSKYKHYLGQNLIFKAFIPPEEIIEKIAGFRYCLSINSKFASYAFGTKIFDYMALEKKILHISNGGVLYNILQEKQQFVSSYNLEEMKNILLKIKDDYMMKSLNNNIEYNDFSLDEITLKIEKLFI